jgi:lipopolysaccharide transport system permease protein/teichoic acid transport system permease protein
VFFRDVQKIVESVVTIWFWLTPIVWNIDLLPAAYRPWLALNPASYVVSGYRDSLIGGVPLWQHPGHAAVFWAVCIALLAAGAWVFERLKPDFAEVM